MLSLEKPKFRILMWYNLPNLVDHTFNVYLWNVCLTFVYPRLQSFSPLFCRGFMVGAFIFKFICDSFSVNFCVWYKLWVEIFVYIIWITNIPALLVEKTLLFPMHCLGSFVEYRVDLLLDSILFCWAIFQSLCQYHIVLMLNIFEIKVQMSVN